MLKGIDVNEQNEFTYSKDNSDPKTIFIIKTLSGIEKIRLASKLDDADPNSDFIESLIEMCVVEIKNPNIKHKDKVFEFVSNQEVGVIKEIVEEINSIISLTGEEQKNS